jgi:hypothetical protein
MLESEEYQNTLHLYLKMKNWERRGIEKERVTEGIDLIVVQSMHV